MKVYELMLELEKCDPMDELYLWDGEYGPAQLNRIEKKLDPYAPEKVRDHTYIWCLIN